VNEAQVHEMCAYLRGGTALVCVGCPARVETPYGPGEMGCYGLALEALEKAAAILDSPADPIHHKCLRCGAGAEWLK
jgi:hypothetical protein